MKKTKIFLIIVLLTGLFYKFNLQKNKTIELVGHWHLEAENGEDRFAKTIDFENDTVVILNKHIGGYGGLNGWHYSDKLLKFGGEGIMVKLKYSVEKEKIIFIEDSGNEKEVSPLFYGIKCELDCCDKQSEYFYDTNVEIDLPLELV